MDFQNRAIDGAIRVLAWLCLAFIVFVTVGPIGVRPVTGASPQLERLVAFAVMGALFAAAYPRHIVAAAVVVIGAAVLLEIFQLLEPSRHGRLFDAAVKIVGGALGISAGWVFARLTARR
ncbi:MAG: hypothetical protein WBA29_14240 [Xanthobacteraceae bacterium]